MAAEFTVAKAPSDPNTGMGANVLDSGGVSFRVWAPNASAVDLLIRKTEEDGFVRLALQRDEDNPSYWSGDIARAGAGNRYRFSLRNDGSSPDDPGGVFERVDPYARKIFYDSPETSACVVQPGYEFAPFQTPPFADFVIYQLHVGSFAGYHDDVDVRNRTATFRQVADAKLDGIAAMHFTAVQLLPICESPPRFSESYSPSNFFAPDTDYGDPEDFYYLVDQCHRRGLAVLMDVVYNHVTATNADDRLLQFDGNAVNDGRGIYFSDRDFNGPVPDIDRPEVYQFFLDNARQCFREYNVDGIRFDSAHNIYGDIRGVQPLREMIQTLRTEFPEKLLLAEHDDPPYAIDELGFDASWEMGSPGGFLAALQGGSIDAIQHLIDFRDRPVPHTSSLIRYFLGSHDNVFSNYVRDHKTGEVSSEHWDSRYFVEKVGGTIVGRDDWDARAKARMGWALAAVSPGLPMLFMGTECHHHGYWNPGPDACPTDHRYDWKLAGDAIGKPMTHLVADANKLRAENAALRSDDLTFTHRDDEHNIIGFLRRSDDGDLLAIVANFSDQEWHQPVYPLNVGEKGAHWEEVFNSQAPKYGGYVGSGNYRSSLIADAEGHIAIRLPKWSVLVFRKR